MTNLEEISGSKADFVYRAIRNNIISGKYAPGTALYIRELSLQLEVSRTPVKEAVTRLAYEGYVEMLPNRCAIVSRISSTEVIELLELREALERTTAYYAAQRRTDADILDMQQISEQHRAVPTDDTALLAEWDKHFHMAVAKAACNHQIYQALEKVFTKLTRITLPISRSRRNDSLVQHTAILNAIKDGNAEAARQHMSEHNQDILSSVKLYQYQNIHLFK